MVKDNAEFRIVGSDNLFKLVNGKGYYLEDYDDNSSWRRDEAIEEGLKQGFYKVDETNKQI